LLILATKVCSMLAHPFPIKSEAYAETPEKSESGKAKVSSYFLQEPYGPNTYSFGYEINDPQTHNSQFREEKRFVNGSIQGSYGYARPDGKIELTSYTADEEKGYSAKSKTFQKEDEKLKAAWPTQRPDILVERDRIDAPGNVTLDPNSNLNVSVSQVNQHVAQQLKDQHGLDLNHIDVSKDVLKPAVLDVIQGKAPAKVQPVQNVIPPQFPIVPFMLPTDQETPKVTTDSPSTVEPKKSDSSKYNKAKSNNDEKAPQVEETEAEKEARLPPPRPLANSSSSHDSWQHRTVEANRREFLANLPNLSEGRP
ncbi:hypothetical protein KR074_002043, partial [Drosophila pseudoananassae]